MIEFVGVDIVAERRINEKILCKVLAEVFSIHVDRVVTIEDVAEYPEKHAADLVCVRTPVGGQFAEILSIQCEKIELPQESLFEPLSLFTRRLKMRCLIPDNSLNPFTMWSLSPGMKPELVSLDSMALDVGRYELAKRPEQLG